MSDGNCLTDCAQMYASLRPSDGSWVEAGGCGVVGLAREAVIANRAPRGSYSLRRSDLPTWCKVSSGCMSRSILMTIGAIHRRRSFESVADLV